MPYTPPATKSELEQWYLVEKKSPEKIGEMFGRKGRAVRDWMERYGIPRLGPKYLTTGKPAPWNAKPKPSHVIESLRSANIGRAPHNKGKGRSSFNCENCGTVVFDKPYRRKRTCSTECRGKLRGTSHWNYKDGGVASIQRQRLWSKTTEWRKGVLERDGLKCKRCCTTHRLVAHHLDGWAKHPELRHDPQNGVTLCHDCHWQFHRDTSHKSATKVMFEVWIRTPIQPPCAK